MPGTDKFADLGRPRRIWAVGAIHAQIDRLGGVHELIASRFQPGDRIVYLGNMIGWGTAVIETIDTLLAFRRAVLAAQGAMAGDVVYLRGGQEEMWQKLLQLQFAPNPGEVFDWMLRQGVAPTLAAYGGLAELGMASARGGAMATGRWTQSMRAAMQAHPGHENLFSALRRAAHAGPTEAGGVLLVSAGVDPSRPFGHQGDSFWWGGAGFARIDEPYGGFRRVVRGFDPARQGLRVSDFTATLDGGCGFGGHLVCGCLSPTGEILDLFQV
ncbi:hypothetical protein HL658_25990 [Azospirillum sp. RWY-5-1]|uniref:Serine/threonine protein phosphatase n=1 Tax=Azospirillum oleiclasticum TaxID=2735135 RepID=A0ABX2TGP8_9PROT|nr:hypothetical protein [Azospirillum oleiclasticum]NYZ16005.1 hypothetical protein [Azospirillum oleiclasticum]NYZ23516.1 hypothetical protein [Azospirillum oleiclasticum]